MLPHLTTHEPVQAEPVVRRLSRWRPCAESLPKSFQKRSVSSAPAETTVVPSGEAAIWSTRCVWPVSSAVLVIEGYLRWHVSVPRPLGEQSGKAGESRGRDVGIEPGISALPHYELVVREAM